MKIVCSIQNPVSIVEIRGNRNYHAGERLGMVELRGQKEELSTWSSVLPSSPSNSKDKLFMPTYLSFDGSFLWVGEMKWSDRLLRFSVQPGD